MKSLTLNLTLGSGIINIIKMDYKKRTKKYVSNLWL